MSSVARAQNSAEQTINLDPFEVKADSDTSYGALSSRSITAFNTQLDHLPVSADIFDQAFMNDVGSNTVEDMLQYSAGTAIVGFSGTPAQTGQPFDQRNQAYPTIRGMMTPNMQRDSLLLLGTTATSGSTALGRTNNFDLDRVEVIFGPQALLYDGGGAGGVVNTVSKQAHFNAPASASDQFRIDEYGTKYNVFDVGGGGDHVAYRLAGINATESTRRINIGDRLNGLYGQFAFRFANTTVRVSAEQTLDDWTPASYFTLNSAGDPNFKQDNGEDLVYLLATNQAGGLVNGRLNWSNVGSLRGDLFARYTVSEFAEIEADSQWTSWLSTQLSAGYSDFVNVQGQYSGSTTFYSPGATANPLPGNWTLGMSANYAYNAVWRVFRGKGLRFSALMTNPLFGGKAKSQTIVGGDYVGDRGSITPKGYYLADANWNLVPNAGAANAGRTIIPAGNWTVNDGPVQFPLFRPGAPRVTYAGQNYLLQPLNPMTPDRVTATNPLGTAIAGGAADQRPAVINEGVYATNYTNWMAGRLDTMLGVRLEHQYTYTANQGGNPNYMEITENHTFNFEVGADYHVLPWLAPYASLSNSYLIPPSQGVDPNNVPFPTSEGLGAELGVKLNDPAGKLSGSIAYYHNRASNEQFQLNAALLNDISPSGLNGRTTASGFVADTESDGVQVTLTANPVPNWRLRLSAGYANGRVQDSRSYGQIYNDQFHENAQGQVTYADGAVVYVAPTFNSKTPGYTAANAPAGSVPLTVTKMSTPSDLYYANPNLTSGQINPGSNAAKVLTTPDPTHGAVLTGAIGLPISAYQLVPSLVPGLSLPGTIPVAAAGEQTWGYPRVSANLTSVYEISRGPLKGFRFGGTVTLGWKDLSYYYFPQGLGTGGNFSPSPFSLPNIFRVDPLVAYTRRFGRVTFTSQLNIENVFNRYHVVIYPDQVTGWTNAANLTANFDQQPRSYLWTNTFKF